MLSLSPFTESFSSNPAVTNSSVQQILARAPASGLSPSI
jgi:hypothetical protein